MATQMATCEYCGRTLQVFDPENDTRGYMDCFTHWNAYGDKLHQPKPRTMVSWGPDPFNSEINGDNTPHWQCEECEYGSAMEI